MKPIRFLIFFSLGILVLSCAKAGTHSLSLRYQPVKDFPTLQTKMGSTVGIAPFKDKRQETLYIGIHTSSLGETSYFKSNPFPLERAIQECLLEVLSRHGIKTVPISHWDVKPESLKKMEVDSVLMVEIKRFWTEGEASVFTTHLKTMVQLNIHLGVKKEKRVFTKNVEIEKEMTEASGSPEKVEAIINQILTDIFDSYFSNPY